MSVVPMIVDSNTEEILTSKSDGMDVSCTVNAKDTEDDLGFVHKQSSPSPKINSENDSSFLASASEDSSGQTCADFEIAKTTLRDSKDEVQCLVPVETNSEFEETQAVIGETNLPEFVSVGPQIPECVSTHISEVQHKVSAEDNDAQLSEQIVSSCTLNADKNISTPSHQSKENLVSLQLPNVVSSLSSLAAAYASSDSDDDDDDDEPPPSPCEVITIVDDAQHKTQYRSKPENEDSSSEDTDSDSDDSDSDDTSDSNSESDSEIEESCENISRPQQPKIKKTKSEFEDLPPIEDLKITVPEALCDRLGEVSGIVEQLVIVRPISGKPTLNLDSILFLEKGHRVLGQVFDVFGQVADPHYCVRFNSEQHIKEAGVALGMEVYYSPNTEHTSLVFLHELVKLKGVDISGEDDIEPPEFSDDEEERAYNQLQRQKQRQKPGASEKNSNSEYETHLQKRQCNERQRNPWSSDWQSQNYNNPRSNVNFSQGHPRWSSESSQNSFNLQNPSHPSNQPPSNQYGQPNVFNTSTPYPYNLYSNPYQQNNMFSPPNPGYAFGRPPGFRPGFNNYGPNMYQPNPYPPPPMSWAPPPPPPPPPSSM